MCTIQRHAFSFARIALGAVLGLTLGSAGIAKAATNQQLAAKPAWPNNGIAQRMFPHGSTMFVENDNGKWSAWVLESAPGDNVQALDFFSGRHMRVKVDLEDDGRQEQSFTDARGVYHSNVGREYAFSGTSLPIDLPSISFDGKNIFLEPSSTYCSSNLIATTPTHNYVTGQSPASAWNRLAIYHQMGNPKACPGGSFDSKITSALDLNDGTFLAVEGCFVFRLRKSDLSPAGSAPALRVLDKSAVQVAINQAKRNNIHDTTAYIAKTLNLPTIPELSCRDD